MYTKEKLLQMLTSKKASVRYEACEWIRVSQDSSPEIVTALEKATHDTDKEVAERATLALQADVHHKMAIKMGMIEPDKTEENENIQTEKTNTENIERKHSVLGIASFITIIIDICIIILFLFYLVMNIYEVSINEIHMGILISLVLASVALGLGIGGLQQKDRKKIFAFLGTLFSAMIILCLIISEVS